MNKTLVCTVATQAEAESIVESLQRSGFAASDISVLFPEKQGSRDFAHEHNTKAPEGAIAGVGAGGLLGGTLGALAGIGALAIPGLGPFIAAGPLLAALSGAAVGATVGGIAGALIGMGIPEIEAKRYEGKVKAGRILISVHTEDDDERRAAERIFEDAGGDDLNTTDGSEVPSAVADTRRL